MSVINQMLQELEQNHGGSASLDPLIKDVRTVAEGKRPAARIRGALVFLVILLIVAAAAAAWYWLAPQLRSATEKKPAPPPVRSVAVLPPPPVPAVVAPAPPPAPAKAVLPPKPVLPPPSSRPAKVAAAAALPPPSGEGGAPEEKKTTPDEKKAAPGEDADGKRTKPKAAVSAKAAPSSGKLVKQVTPQQQAEFLYQKAVALLQQGRTAEAETGLGEALKLDPDHQSARQLWVGLLLEQKQYILAEQLLQEGVLAHPERIAMAMTLARLQVEQGNERGGLETVERTLIRVPRNPDLHGFAAVLLQRMGRHGEAATHFREALKAVPGAGNWWIGLGISLRAEKKLEEAEAAFRRAKSTEGLSPELQSFAEQQIRSIHQPGK